MEIKELGFEGVGLDWVHKTEAWGVGVKNYKPANDIENLDNLERHNGTDELFILLGGYCCLLFANEENGKLAFRKLPMQQGKVYAIPAGLWHNTVTRPGVKLALIENCASAQSNSDVVKLTDVQIAEAKALLNA
jgi:mannose-6-phosphate isomerase-like protein (cupin superfamily)